MSGRESGRFDTHREMQRKSANLDKCESNEHQWNADANCDEERNKIDKAYEELKAKHNKYRKR